MKSVEKGKREKLEVKGNRKRWKKEWCRVSCRVIYEMLREKSQRKKKDKESEWEKKRKRERERESLSYIVYQIFPIFQRQTLRKGYS